MAHNGGVGGGNQDQAEQKSAPIIHVRADSDSCLEELFTLGLKPPGAQPMMPKPLRLRNLPQSCFNPPSSGGSRSPSCHSRENSLDSSGLLQPYSPMQQPVGSPQPQIGQTPQPIHTRAHSSPANLQQTLAAVQQQQQQHFHLRQPSCDVSGSADLGPLPPGWEPARTPQGQLYFMNHITKTTQWEDPRLQIQQQNIKEQQLGQIPNNNLPQTLQQKQLMMSRPLPHGWEQGVTPEGEVYFINHVTKTTTWFDPRIPINMQTGPNVRVGSAQVQQQQQMLRLQRLENERRVLQQRQAELEKMEQNRLIRQQSMSGGNRGFHDNIQAAVNATQEMLMRQSLNSDGAPSPQDPFHPLNHRPLEMQHIREESADSGLGMGSNFNLGSIPEDMGMDGMDSMDTGDLDTTLTDPATPTPTTNLIGCGMQQQQVVDAGSAMESGDTLIPNLQNDIGEEFQNDLMQTILTSQNQQQNQQLPNEGPLTWL